MEPFIRLLERLAFVSDEAKCAVRTLPTTAERTRAGRNLVTHDAAPTDAHLILSGFACRYITLADGERHIVSLLIPGDVCNLRSCIVQRPDHSIGAIDQLETLRFSRIHFEPLLQKFPELLRALWLSSQVEEATSMAWVLNVGHRTALQRTAHLFCELFSRLNAVGLTQRNVCHLPLTQGDLGEALGLSSVHVNRTLQEMRRRHLISFRRHELVIHDFAALQRAAAFNPDYLRLKGPSPFLDGAFPSHHFTVPRERLQAEPSASAGA
jgi:CRP-like cAMP-binding protein